MVVRGALCSIQLTHEFHVSRKSRESDSLWTAAACCSMFLLHVIMRLPFATRMYQAIELETVAHWCSQYPDISYLTSHGLLFYFYFILPRDYKPVHPSPLAFIILLLEIIQFMIALSFGGGFSGCLDDSCRMNSTIAGWHTWHSLGTHSAHRYHHATSNYGNFVWL